MEWIEIKGKDSIPYCALWVYNSQLAKVQYMHAEDVHQFKRSIVMTCTHYMHAWPPAPPKKD